MKRRVVLLATLLLLLLSACNSNSPVRVLTPPAEGSDGTPSSAPLGPVAPDGGSQPTSATDVSAPPAPVAGATTVVAEGTLPASAGRIAYMGLYGEGGAMRSFMINADGTGLTPLAESLAVSYYPSLSPDNAKVLLVGPSEGDASDAEIYLVDVASGSLTNLTQRAGRDLQPAWSPDGTMISFISEREGGNMDLWVMEADGSNPRRVAQTPASEQNGSWSPDGKQIVMSSKDEIGEALWVVEVETGTLTRLTESVSGTQDSAPAWSPDGTMIAFHSSSPTALPTIYTISPLGGERTARTDSTQAAVLPIWSPDGTHLLFTITDGQSRYDLNALELATSQVRLIPNAQGLGGSWKAAETPLPETGFTQGPAMTNVEIAPEVLADAPRRGDDDAPVKIIEFSDYQCPFCERFVRETLPQLEPLIEAGTVQLIFVDYPLNIHPQAPAASQAAHCAADQKGNDGYWAMHDALFASMDQWSGNSTPAPIFAALATEAGLDGAALQACVEAGTHEARVNAALEEGQRLGISGTPTFFINGDRVVGAVPFGTFEAYLP